MSTATSSKTSRRPSRLIRVLATAAATLAVVTSASPFAIVPLTNKPGGVSVLEKKCPNSVKVIDHGTWVEASCDFKNDKNLSTRASGYHFYSFQQGNSYVAVLEAATIARSITAYGSTWSQIVNAPKMCTSDQVFCFDVWDDICEYFYANASWEKYCGNWKSIDFYA
ncbi:hypothetical protein EDD21DRAFT_386894 [Dissophora ornata]|nr:hypothetical protein BGZ58_010818 [Dissophora ornata]KAI8596909.1 hypothetical protein EDD21DRAFT_386894 [Dissophora ornata]